MLMRYLNARVLIGLGAASIAIIILAPDLLTRAVPVVLVWICPLSMLAMLLVMGRMGSGQKTSQTDATMPPSSVPTVRAGAAPPPERQLEQLHAELAVLAEEQAAVAREIALLQAGDASLLEDDPVTPHRQPDVIG